MTSYTRWPPKKLSFVTETGSNILSFPSRGATILTKKQLAGHLKRSERWIEIKVRDEGLPVLEATDRFGRRRYNLHDVEDWLQAGKSRSVGRQDRFAVLEARVAALEAEIQQLRGRV